ncbi:MAG: DUF4124 domain-containing protein [Halobacteria archaeon]|nr:DUF4124 domain-containing protein [Halobacteria archaeon]
MKTTNTMAAIAVVLVATPLHSGGIKKWIDADGTITFGDVPPPGAINTETIRHHASTPGPALKATASGTGAATSDYYSPEKQLRRIEAKSRQKKIQSRQQRNAARQDELSRQQSIDRRHETEKERRIHRARCNQYNARIDEYEHKTIQGYRHEADRLSDRSQLARLRKLETELCD